jgi:UDP-N-acetylglucosamine diphosphorylase/glucosamine-1-phosphate N-acetyltransferase
MSQQIVILAAGKGTRMGVDVPKVLLPLGDKPVISRLLEEIKSVPQDTAPVVVVGFKKELVEETLGEQYIFATQFDQKGTAHAVLSAKQAITAKNIIVLNGDMPFITKESLEKVIELHTEKNSMLTMMPCTLPNFDKEYANLVSYGRIIRDKDWNIKKIQEYKDCTEEQKQITEVNSGCYMFNTEWLWSKLEKIGHTNSQDEFYLTDIVEIAIADGQIIQSMQVAPKEIYGINTPDNLLFAKSLLK